MAGRQTGQLNWPGRNYYATCWASEKDAAVVQDYLCGERGGDLGILDFQRNVRDEQLEQRHKRITGAWDQDLAQVPDCPRIGCAGLIRWLCGKISSSIAINAAEPKRLLYLLWERGPYIRASISQ